MVLLAFPSQRLAAGPLPRMNFMKNVLMIYDQNRAFIISEPIMGNLKDPTYHIQSSGESQRIQPYLPSELSVFEKRDAMIAVIKELIVNEDIRDYIIWTDTPKAMPFIRNLNALTVIYDRTQDYSRTYPELESELLQYADNFSRENDVAFSLQLR